MAENSVKLDMSLLSKVNAGDNSVTAVSYDDATMTISEHSDPVTYNSGNKLAFELSSDGESYTVTGYGTMTDGVIEIPPYYKEKPVREIADDAFAELHWIKSVIIPSTVRYIGSHAFYLCSQLSSVTIALDSVLEYIGINAFGYTAIETIHLPSSITNIDYKAFYGSKLKQVTIGGRSTTIFVKNTAGWEAPHCKYRYGMYAPGDSNTYDSDVEAMTLIGTDNSYDVYAYSIPGDREIYSIRFFSNNTTTAVASKEVYEVFDRICFDLIDAYTLERIEVPFTEGLIIGSEAFYGNPLEYFTIPNTAVEISFRAFGNTNLSKVYIPDTVNRLGNQIFMDCHNLVEVEIASGSDLNYLPYGMFSGCENLKTVTLSNRISRIGEYAFSGTTSLTEIKFPGMLKAIEHSAFINSGIAGHLTFPSFVTTIGERAFCQCRNLTQVTTSSVTSIGKEAFVNCQEIARVNIGSSVTWIGEGAFKGCDRLLDGDGVLFDNPYGWCQTTYTTPEYGTSIQSSVLKDGLNAAGFMLGNGKDFNLYRGYALIPPVISVGGDGETLTITDKTGIATKFFVYINGKNESNRAATITIGSGEIEYH